MDKNFIGDYLKFNLHIILKLVKLKSLILELIVHISELINKCQEIKNQKIDNLVISIIQTGIGVIGEISKGGIIPCLYMLHQLLMI